MAKRSLSWTLFALVCVCSGRVDDRSTFGPTGPVTTDPNFRGQLTDASYVLGDCELVDASVPWQCPKGYECVSLGAFGVTGATCFNGKCPVCARPNVYEVLVCDDPAKKVGVLLSYPAIYDCQPRT